MGNRLASSTVQVGGRGKDGETVLGCYGHGIFVEETAVCLEVDDTARFQELAVTLQEQRTGKAGILTFKLRIGKREPDFTNFTWTEESLYKLDSCAQKCHIIQLFLCSSLSSLPKSCSFYVNSYVIPVRNSSGKVYRVLPFPASQFEHDRLVLGEHRPIPMTLYRMVVQAQS